MKKHQSQVSGFILKCLKDPTLLNKFKKDPKRALEEELKIKLPDTYQLEVLQETAQKGYIVIPAQEVVQECSEEELKAIAAGSGALTSFCSGPPCHFPD